MPPSVSRLLVPQPSPYLLRSLVAPRTPSATCSHFRSRGRKSGQARRTCGGGGGSGGCGGGRAATSFSTFSHGSRTAFSRHGKAVEPSPQPPGQDGKQEAKEKKSGGPEEVADGGDITVTAKSPGGTGSVVRGMGSDSDPTTTTSSAGAVSGPIHEPTDINRTSAGPGDETKTDAKKSGPMQAVMHLGPPTLSMTTTSTNNGPLTFILPSYVHHFDTYSLVKQLQEGGFTHKQAITSMKAIRNLLAMYLDVAQESLVSKSDVENETYLFRAACSELSAEVKNNRRVADENMRRRRILLQHEVDILTQTLNQELLTLNDSVRGMFNDRRMTVREEQRTTDSAIQQISYKISIMLSSEAKSEIESLRWILIRRSVLGIIVMAVLTLGTLRYATYVSHERLKEAERRRKEENQRRQYGKGDQAFSPDTADILAAG